MQYCMYERNIIARYALINKSIIYFNYKKIITNNINNYEIYSTIMFK